jgi:hypothetical protein
MTHDEKVAIKASQLGGGIGDGTGYSWLFTYSISVGKAEARLNPGEKEILQRLARQMAYIADLPIQEERRKLWTAHNSLIETRPLIFIDPEFAWFEILPNTVLECSSALGRIWEYRLRKEIFWQEKIGDDRVCRKEFPVPYVFEITDFGIKIEHEGTGIDKAHSIKGVIKDYDDLGKLKHRDIIIDYAKTAKMDEIAHDCFDGILEVKRDTAYWYSFGLTVNAIDLRGFENFLFDMYDYPDELKALMQFLSDDMMRQLDFLEKNGFV